MAGHTRLKAAKKLGLKTVPCVIADDLTEEQIRAYRLADNKTSEFATWDLPGLKLELKEIKLDMPKFGFDLSFPGYPASSREDLTPYRPEPEPEPDRNEPPVIVEDDYEQEPPKQPKAKRGDMYQLGRHRLMCGDATNEQNIIALMGGASC